MSLRIDLHSHSTASDGTLAPAALVAHAHARGVDVLALTDHDSCAGYAEAAGAAGPLGLTLLAGIEISVTWSGQTVHILGLRLDPDNAVLQAGLQGLRDFRDWRAEEIGRRLARHGIEGALDGARAHARGRIVSRTHFARFLVEAGHASDLREVFKRFLTHNRPGHVPGQWATLADAMSWIQTAGGEAVIAHPARYNFTASKLRRLLGEFRELGGVGMEVVSGSHSRDDVQSMARHAQREGLRGSAGSDYHGPENPWIELGRLPMLPRGVVPVWQDWELPPPRADREALRA